VNFAGAHTAQVHERQHLGDLGILAAPRRDEDLKRRRVPVASSTGLSFTLGAWISILASFANSLLLNSLPYQQSLMIASDGRAHVPPAFVI
jgi:hypothetical protein